MRLLHFDTHGEVRLTKDLTDQIPPYAILSHTWGPDEDEITFEELNNGVDKSKGGYRKLQFCGAQAEKDQLKYFWVDTCCINKANHTELSEAIASMFRWYRDADKCYVYLSDVPAGHHVTIPNDKGWEAAFRQSRWFTRGWTLQELLAPSAVEFFSRKEEFLGSKKTLEGLIHEITQIPTLALRITSLSTFPVDERLRWAEKRNTKKPEDKAYCLLGIFNVHLPLIYGERDHAFTRLKAEIAKHSGVLLSAVHTHWIVTRPPNPLFTGREDILQELDSVVRDAVYSYTRQNQCRVVITGMGGQGKSEICLQLAHRMRQSFWGVFWIDVSTTSLAEESFVDLAHKLALPPQTWEDACLAIANLKHPWLLVLDNADNPEIDYQPYFPSSPLGVVMLTSRNDECHPYASIRPIVLNGLADEDADRLLLKAARVPQGQHNVALQDARTVASLLQSHPLALIQAGAYIARGLCTLVEYPGVYKQQRQQLLTFRPAQARSRYRDVYATFEVSAKVLKNSNTEAAQDALELLPLLAVCDPNRLPLALFEAGWWGAKTIPADCDVNVADEEVLLLTAWHVARLPSLVHQEADVCDPYRLVEAVQQLKAFALVSTDSDHGHLSVSMHPLAHAWARDRQDDSARHTSWVQMGCLMAIGSEAGHVWSRHAQQLQPHIEAVVAWEARVMFAAESVVMVARILVNCGWILHHLRSDSRLSVLVERLFQYLQLDPVVVEDQWIGLYNLMGRKLVHCGKAKEAVLILEAIVTTRGPTLAEDHPSRLMSQHELAGAYQANGQVKEAVALIELVTKVKEQTLAEDHPSRLMSQHALARAYQANGQVKEAVALLERVVKIQEQTLAEDHPSRLTSQHNLAVYLWELGRFQPALDIMERVNTRRQVLDKSHPDRQKAEAWLGHFYNEIAQSGKV